MTNKPMNFLIRYFPFFLLFISCEYGKKHLGKLPIKNQKNIYFDLYQEKNFGHNVAITYEIIDNNNLTIYGPHFFTSTSNLKRESTDDFFAASYDSIIYLTYLDTNIVYVMYDLSTKKEPVDLINISNIDSTLEIRLKKYKPNLKTAWQN